MNKSRDKMRKTLQGMQIADEFEDEAVQWLLEQEQAQAEEIEGLKAVVEREISYRSENQHAHFIIFANLKAKIKKLEAIRKSSDNALADIILALKS